MYRVSEGMIARVQMAVLLLLGVLLVLSLRNEPGMPDYRLIELLMVLTGTAATLLQYRINPRRNRSKLFWQLPAMGALLVLIALVSIRPDLGTNPMLGAGGLSVVAVWFIAQYLYYVRRSRTGP